MSERTKKVERSESSCESNVIRVDFRSPKRHLRSDADRREAAYGLYLRANVIDENPLRREEAERLYRESIALDPTSAIAHVNLGNVVFRIGRFGSYEEAMRLYEHALTLDSYRAEAYYNIGYLLLETGEYSRAVTSLEKAVKYSPRFEDAHFNLAMALDGLGRTDAARRSWRRYLALEPLGPFAEAAREHLRSSLAGT